MNTLQPGTRVRYAEPLNATEAAMVFVVCEDRGDRVVIQQTRPLPGGIFPQECVRRSDIIQTAG